MIAATRAAADVALLVLVRRGHESAAARIEAARILGEADDVSCRRAQGAAIAALCLEIPASCLDDDEDD